MAKRKAKTPDEADASVSEGVPAPSTAPGSNAGSAQTDVDGEPEKKWVDPVSRHLINLGDGRHLGLARSNRWQQMQIRFIADREDVDPRPSKEDTELMKEHGFQWRNKEKVWTKQLAKNSEQNWSARGNSDQEAHEQFVELANRIRQRNGLEPVSGPSEGRSV